MVSSKRRAVLEGITAGISFGTAAIFIRLIKLNAISIVTYRLLIGGLILYFVLKPSFKLIKMSLKDIFILSTLLFMHFMFFVKSVQDTFVLNATLLVNTAPILSILITGLLSLERIELQDLLVVFLGFLGAFTMVGSYGVNAETFVGDLEALLAALFISLYAIYARKRQNSSFEFYRFSGPIYFLSGMESVIISVSTTTLIVSMGLLDMIFLFALALIPTGIGHTLYLKTLEVLKPHEIQTISLLEPVSASIFAAILFSEVPTINQVIGGVLVVVSLMILAIRKSR